MDGKVVAEAVAMPKAGVARGDLALVIAAFVQDLKTGEVLQAVSAPLCR